MNKTAVYSALEERKRYHCLCKGNLRRQKVTICAKNVIKLWHIKFLPYQGNTRNSLTTLRSCRLSLRFTVFLRDSVSWSRLHTSAEGYG